MTAQEPEEWRVVPGFDGWYEASDLGRVRSWRTRAKWYTRAGRPGILGGNTSKDGYVRVKVTHPVFGKLSVSVDQLVLAAFAGPRPHGHVGDHINASPSDNRPTNLRWLTAADNIKHAAALGRMNGRAGSRSNSILSVSDVQEIRRLVDTGQTRTAVAQKYGVSLNAVSLIALRRTWKEIK